MNIMTPPQAELLPNPEFSAKPLLPGDGAARRTPSAHEADTSPNGRGRQPVLTHPLAGAARYITLPKPLLLDPAGGWSPASRQP